MMAVEGILKDLPDLERLVQTWQTLMDAHRPGRPSTVRAADVAVIYVAKRAFMTERRCIDELCEDAVNWKRVRRRLKKAYPSDKSMWPSKRPPTRSSYRRAYNRVKLAGLDRLLDEMLEDFRFSATTILDVSRQPYAKPSSGNFIYGDATMMKTASRYTAGDSYVDRHTGEVRPRRFDPSGRVNEADAGNDRGRSRGVYVMMVSQRNREGGERLILGEEEVPLGTSDATVFVDWIESHQSRLSDVSVAIYDGALQGQQAHRLVAMGIVPMNYVKLGPDGRLDTANLGTHEFRLASGAIERCAVFTVDGHAGILLSVAGDEWWIPLRRVQVRPGHNTVYLESMIPNHAVVPRRLRGATVRIRLNSTERELAAGVNRAQHIRAYPPQDEIFEEFYGLREDAESINAHLQRECWQRGRLRTYNLVENLRDISLWSAFQAFHAQCLHQRRIEASSHPPPLAA